MCHAVPGASAVVTSLIWSKTRNTKTLWLSLLFWGAALFGVVDHLWNGEFFLVKDLAADMLLGFTITGLTFLFWVVLIVIARMRPSFFTRTVSQK
ncbi:MAG: hypothetical protein ABH865_06960 [Candidatus Omnitrophota bacterium]